VNVLQVLSSYLARAAAENLNARKGLAEAWLRDSRAILISMRFAFSRLHQFSSKACLADLCSVLSSWIQLYTSLVATLQLQVTESATASVVAPFAAQKWQPPATQSPTTSGIVIATFGWWESKVPTQTNIADLCAQLSLRRVAICAVTGLPAAKVLGPLDGCNGFFWLGPVRSDFEAAGFLVRNDLRDFTHRIPDPVCEHPRRCPITFCRQPIMAVYGPYVGKLPAIDHKAFLLDTINAH
jgi:hypothetical protein